jgi:hypothetical protein
MRAILRTRLAPVSLAILSLAIAAACSGSGASASPPYLTASPTASTGIAATPSPTSTSVPTPTLGPATQTLALVGPAAVTGALTGADIRCAVPSTSGLQIQILARPTDPTLSVYLFISAGSISVRFDSGAGTTYTERDFAGTGVSGFDASHGATIDTALTEVPTTDAPGTLGVLTHLSGSIDCGNQQPGLANLTLSGTTAAGDLSGGPASANVECVNSTANGHYITIQALVTVGGSSNLAIIYFSASHYSVSIANDGFFVGANASLVAMSADGAQVAAGDLVEQVAAGKPFHTIHLAGSVVCGTFVSN